MKRFLMFLVIAIAVVSLGLTIYYFSADNEVIYIKSSYLVVNTGDTIQTEGENGLLDFKNKSEYTTLSYGIEQSETVLSYNEEGYYKAENGGESKIVITTNNRSYSRLVIDVLVCDGSENFPYIVKTEEDLKKIGKEDPNENDTLEANEYSYKLGNDIELTQPWTPIGTFAGTFDGNHFTISNMQITEDSINGNSAAQAVVLASGSDTTRAAFISILEETGVVKNLFLSNVNINVAANYMGSFVGTNYGLIQTSEADGTLINTYSGSTTYTGGIAGQNLYDGKKAKIDRCGFAGTIESKGTQQVVGGVIGQNTSGMISESYFRGIVKNNESFFGGVVGYNKGTSDATADVYDCYCYLTENDAKTIKTKIGGVVYNNENASQENMVTGCYYGGATGTDLSDVNEVNKGDNFVSKANGFLSTANFKKQTSFLTTKANDGNNRTWNFNTVWELPSSSAYPILNVFSSVGSSYIIDVSGIETDDEITTAQELYDFMSGKSSMAKDTYKITKDIDLNPKNSGGFYWGDASHPIPESFKKELINGTTIDNNGTPSDTSDDFERPCKILNLVIKNTTDGDNVGMVKTLAEGAVISGVVIDNVTIEGEDGNYVGVLGGISDGANIYNVTVQNVTVNINGTAFGTIVGRAEDVDGYGIKNVTVKFVDSTSKHFVYAGGVVGINLSTVTATNKAEDYNYIYDVDVLANFVGGVAGANGGDISYTTAYDIQFNKLRGAAANNTVYNGDYNVFIGGIAGTNEYTELSKTSKGTIVDIYTNLDVTAETGPNYAIYIGGVVGFNSNYVVRAYVTKTTIDVEGSQTVVAGGIAGYNTGRIANSVVDEDCSITTSIVASLGADKTSDKYVLNTANCSVVGGLVGYDALTSNSTYSIYECLTYMNTIKGYYAGGISGISFGKVERSYCGKTTHIPKINGFLAGGISAVVAGGFVKNCYTICSIATTSYSGKYSSVLSVVTMDVSAAGGLAVLVLNENTVVEGCYAVATFSGNGVSYGSSADLTGYVCGKINKCAYQNAGSIKTSYGTQISQSNMKGADKYHQFTSAVCKNNNDFLIWDLTDDVRHYPTLVGVSVEDMYENIPVFH